MTIVPPRPAPSPHAAARRDTNPKAARALRPTVSSRMALRTESANITRLPSPRLPRAPVARAVRRGEVVRLGGVERGGLALPCRQCRHQRLADLRVRRRTAQHRAQCRGRRRGRERAGRELDDPSPVLVPEKRALLPERPALPEPRAP